MSVFSCLFPAIFAMYPLCLRKNLISFLPPFFSLLPAFTFKAFSGKSRCHFWVCHCNTCCLAVCWSVHYVGASNWCYLNNVGLWTVLHGCVLTERITILYNRVWMRIGTGYFGWPFSRTVRSSAILHDFLMVEVYFVDIPSWFGPSSPLPLFDNM